MSQPPDHYERIFDFTDFSAMQPDAQHPGQKIDQELNAARESLNETIDRLGEIQRDDGKIRASALDTTEFQGIVNGATAAAAASAASAATSASTATTKASEASASATSASNSATSATASAASVAAQVAKATTAATNASTSATNAATSAADALTSKNSATSSASSATTSAGTAAGSATSAATSATNAATSASNAATSASSASTSATTATTQATAAANSATAAAGSATSAANSATAAANSAASINPALFAPVVHGHVIADVTGLQSALDGKQASGSYASTVHGHVISDVTGLQAALDGKAATVHTHVSTDISDSTAAGRALLTGANASAQRTSLGLGTAALEAATRLIPAGGTTGQALVKLSNADFDDGWATIAGGGGTWGSITGTLSSQTDLNTALGLKADLAGANTFTASNTFSNADNSFGTSTATGTTSIATGATISGATKTVNIGSGGASGSTTNINIGNVTTAMSMGIGASPTTTGLTKSIFIGTGGAAGSTTTITIGATAGTSQTTVNGTLNVNTVAGNAIFTGVTLTFGNSTGTSTVNLASGATLSGSTKTINIGSSGVSGSTTLISIGSSNGSTTQIFGMLTTATSTTTTAGFRIPQGTAPTTPTNGDIWTTSSGMSLRRNGVTVSMAERESNNTFSGTNFFTGTNSFTARQSFSSDATNSAIRISDASVDPSTASVGDLWHNNGRLIFRTYNQSNQLNGVKAWVNFNGTGSGTWAGGTSTVTRTAGSTTATITTTNPHGLSFNNTVWALTGVAAGAYIVDIISSTSFSITTVATTALTSASITFAVNTIRSSFNVSSVADLGVGLYMVNFREPMSDTNYCVQVTCNPTASSTQYVGGSETGTRTAASVQVSNNYGAGALRLDTDFINVAVFA